MPTELARLKTIAEAAHEHERTSGAWSATPSGGGPTEGRRYLRVGMGPQLTPEMDAVAAEHIAAFDPPTVLPLIARAEELEQKANESTQAYRFASEDAADGWSTAEVYEKTLKAIAEHPDCPESVAKLAREALD